MVETTSFIPQKLKQSDVIRGKKNRSNVYEYLQHSSQNSQRFLFHTQITFADLKTIPNQFRFKIMPNLVRTMLSLEHSHSVP